MRKFVVTQICENSEAISQTNPIQSHHAHETILPIDAVFQFFSSGKPLKFYLRVIFTLIVYLKKKI